MSKMNIEPVPWHSNREICPADYDLNEWIAAKVYNSRIFLMGPGYDHLVGKNVAMYSTNTVVSLTHSPGEMSSYMSWAIENPQHTTAYQCLFGDIHLLNRSMLGAFRIAALLHLGEKPGGPIDEVIEKFQTSEFLVFYTGSFAWTTTVAPIVNRAFLLMEQYKSIAIYKGFGR